LHKTKQTAATKNRECVLYSISNKHGNMDDDYDDDDSSNNGSSNSNSSNSNSSNSDSDNIADSGNNNINYGGTTLTPTKAIMEKGSCDVSVS